MWPASANCVSVTVGSKGPVTLSRTLLSENSEYFRTMLQGQFAESQFGEVNIAWEGDEDSCLLFLTWIGIAYSPEELITPECRLKFLKCCIYFKVKESFLSSTLKGIQLAQEYKSLNATMKSAWNRENIPFQIMSEMILKVTSPFEQIYYACAWMDGVPVSTKLELQAVMQGNDFMHLRELLAEKLQIIGKSWSACHHNTR